MGASFVTIWLRGRLGAVGAAPAVRAPCGLLGINESFNWISLRANGRCWPGWRN